ncbi:TPA: hypothetical protein DDW35_08200 [Candidatus Sumerlaeota bacterium]|nr:hypothetical protein [Candidatus Sumerlaeota bacterium]
MTLNLKLGALLGHKDPRNLQMAHYIKADFKWPAVPDPIDWNKDALPAYQMLGNDTAGNCTVAGKYNHDAGCALVTGDSYISNTQLCMQDYINLSGYDPATGSNDTGLNPEDVLRYFSNKPVGDQGRIEVWGEINRKDMQEVMLAMWLFGGAYTAFSLPKSAQSQTGEGKVWDVAKFPSFDRIPGSWGGHMVDVRSRDGKTKIGGAVTWGTVQLFTDAFWKKYCSAAYFYLTEKWIADNTRKTPSGFDLETLLADAAELKAA